jgi:hypothetical protein
MVKMPASELEVSIVLPCLNEAETQPDRPSAFLRTRSVVRAAFCSLPIFEGRCDRP